MTDQIMDRYHYKGQDYSVAAWTNPIHFDPKEYGFQPEPPMTDGWSEYFCEYDITDNGIYLSKLRIYCGDNPYPVFEGVLPVKEKDYYDPFRLYILHHPVKYCGSIILGSGFLRQYHIPYSRPFPWAYENVFDLVFEEGKVIRMIDHSKLVEEIRKQINEDPNFWDKNHDDTAWFIKERISFEKLRHTSPFDT